MSEAEGKAHRKAFGQFFTADEIGSICLERIAVVDTHRIEHAANAKMKRLTDALEIAVEALGNTSEVLRHASNAFHADGNCLDEPTSDAWDDLQAALARIAALLAKDAK